MVYIYADAAHWRVKRGLSNSKRTHYEDGPPVGRASPAPYCKTFPSCIIPSNDNDYPVSDTSTDNDEEHYSPRPKYNHEDHLLDPRAAYICFYLVYTIVFMHSRTEFTLDFLCLLLVLVAMIPIGWISVSDATSFAESWHMLSKGHVRANMICNLGRYDCFVEKLKGTKKLTFDLQDSIINKQQSVFKLIESRCLRYGRRL